MSVNLKDLPYPNMSSILIFNEMELGKARKEHENRTSMNSSRFY